MARCNGLGNCRCQGMFGAVLQGPCELKHLLLRLACQGLQIGEHRLAQGERACLVEDHGGELLSPLQHLAAADQDALLRALAHPHHQGRWGGDAQGTGAGNHQHGDEGQQTTAELARQGPEGKRREGDQHRGWNKPARDLIGQALHAGRAGLGLLHDANDLGQGGVGSHPAGLKTEQAIAIHGAADEFGTGLFGHWQGFTGEQGFVHRGAALQHHPIGGDLLARAHQHRLAGVDGIGGHGHLHAVADHRGRGGLKIEQLAHGGRGAFLDDLLHVFAHQHEGDHHRRDFEIDVPFIDANRKPGGREDHHHAVEVGDGGAQGDQHIHVEGAALEGRPGAGVERPATDELHRSGKHEQPLPPAHPGQCRQRHPGHQADAGRQGDEGSGPEQRQRQHPADHEAHPAAHDAQFAVGILEGLQAGLAAEVVVAAAALGAEGCGLGNHHAADRILGHSLAAAGGRRAVASGLPVGMARGLGDCRRVHHGCS